MNSLDIYQDVHRALIDELFIASLQVSAHVKFKMIFILIKFYTDEF